MPAYKIRLRRVIEWEQTYEEPDLTPAAAVELAKLEAHHGAVIDENVLIEEA